jgi:hypothetical protein
MVVMDLPELDALGAGVAHSIDASGRFILTLLHPAFFLQSPYEDPASGERYRKVRGYLREEVWWIEGWGGQGHYHRPLSFYVNWLAQHGFAVVELFEPPVPRAHAPEEWSDYDRWLSDIPTTLGLVAIPAQSRPTAPS